MSSNLKPQCTPSTAAEIYHYDALVELADLTLYHRNLSELFPLMAERLGKVAGSELVHLYLHDSTQSVMRLHIPEGQHLSSRPTEISPMDSAGGLAWQTQEPLVVRIGDAETRFPSLVDLLGDKGIRSYCALPLTIAQKRLGALGLGSSRVGAYGKGVLHLLRQVARLLAVAVENALMREALEQDKERLRTLLDISTTLGAIRDVEKLFPAISALRRIVEYDYASIAVYDEVVQSLFLYRLDSAITKELVSTGITPFVKDASEDHVLVERQIKTFGYEDLVRIRSAFVCQMLEQGVQSVCCIPLATTKGTLGTLHLASKEHNAFKTQDLNFLKQVATKITAVLDDERSVIMPPETVLQGSLAELHQSEAGIVERTLEEMERDYILHVLRRTRGKVSGIDGCAAKLGLKRTTLQSKMRKLKIQPGEFGKGRLRVSCAISFLEGDK